MKQKVLRTGHSLAVVIPSKFVRDIVVKPGDVVSVTPDSRKGKITYTFQNATQLPLALPKA